MKKRDIILISVILVVAIIPLLAIKLMQEGGTADTDEYENSANTLDLDTSDNHLSQGDAQDEGSSSTAETSAETSKPKYKGYVAVTIKGVTVAEYSLSDDGEYSINNGTNILKIENGEAWMIDADCPTTGSTKCTYQKKISKRGEMITCLPNKVVVMVKDGEPSDLDLIS